MEALLFLQFVPLRLKSMRRWRRASNQGSVGGVRNSSVGEIFLPGQFLGQALAHRTVPGFELATLVPTVPEREVRHHAHADAHFVLLLEGRYLSSAREAPPLCHGPSLIYNPPGTEHRDRFRSATGRFTTISVSPAALREFSAAVRLPNYACAVGRSGLGAALRIARALEDGGAASALELESLCAALLAATAAAEREDAAAAPAWLRRARELLHDSCGAGIHLGELAATMGVHSVHLTRAFRRHFGCTPGEYLRRCRLNQAAAWLGSSARSLSEIAVACGYFDQAHFSRSFKRAYDVSPRAYRARAGGRRRGLLRTRQGA